MKRSLPLLLALLSVLPSRVALAQTLHVLRPVSGATVRETVAVRLAPTDLPDDGYVSVAIDGQFRTARTLPTDKRAAVYDWDTKAPYFTTDDPTTQKYLPDGAHTLVLKLYDHSGKSLGTASIPVHVANKILLPSQGIKLSYRWLADQQLRYQRRTALSVTGSDTVVQASLVTFSRTVEDVSGGNYLLRDRVLPGGLISSGGKTQLVEATYVIKSKYRTVNAHGEVLGVMAPLTVTGEHIAFSVPVLPARRIAVGDRWSAPVQASLEWAASTPATFTAESALEGFEWQDGYPCAKIRETFTGPASFTLLAGGDPVSAQTVKYERVVFFAYGSGRLIHTDTTMDVTATLSSTQSSALGAASGPANGPAPMQPNFQQGMPPGMSQGGQPYMGGPPNTGNPTPAPTSPTDSGQGGSTTFHVTEASTLET